MTNFKKNNNIFDLKSNKKNLNVTNKIDNYKINTFELYSFKETYISV